MFRIFICALIYNTRYTHHRKSKICIYIINKQKIIFTNPTKYYVKYEIVVVINIPVKNLQYNQFKLKKLDASQQIKDNIINTILIANTRG